MADERVIEEVRIFKRGGGAAIIFAFLALVVAIVALVFALRAHNIANTATAKANRNDTRLTSLQNQVNNSLGADTQASSSGAGSGTNTEQPAASGNTNPNGNGQ